jgi:hypothetical protein
MAARYTILELALVAALGAPSLIGCGQCESSAQGPRTATGRSTYTAGDGMVFDAKDGELRVERKDVSVALAARSPYGEARKLTLKFDVEDGPKAPIDLAAAHATLCVEQVPNDQPKCVPVTGTARLGTKYLDCRSAAGVSGCIDHISGTVDARADAEGLRFEGKLDVFADGQWNSSGCAD